MDAENLPVIGGNQKYLPEKGKEEAINKLLSSLPGDVSDGEVMHTTKIRKFLSMVSSFHTTQAYTITDNEVLFERVFVIECEYKGQTITIHRTERILDGIEDVTYQPETIADWKFINKLIE